MLTPECHKNIFHAKELSFGDCMILISLLKLDYVLSTSFQDEINVVNAISLHLDNRVLKQIVLIKLDCNPVHKFLVVIASLQEVDTPILLIYC